MRISCSCSSLSGSELSCASVQLTRPVVKQRQAGKRIVMRNGSTFLALLAGIVPASGAAPTHAQAREEGRMLMASEVLGELRNPAGQAVATRQPQPAYRIAGHP